MGSAAFRSTPATAADSNGDWLGMMVRVAWDRGQIERAGSNSSGTTD